ncbi:hypothetical protein GCM10009504_44440 [Pseudomonas laurentiana]|uniref:DUF6026 family protein n=1 Tax=Pseudomonas laurentiana TaxID=2364649 RepID=UPI00167A4EC5|nr:DUF6026 family protein [Pseudomonas laurentiana]GGU83067.1 hypothetical protein GCM10009504_44440 [Pseudomonas laurentiana]
MPQVPPRAPVTTRYVSVRREELRELQEENARLKAQVIALSEALQHLREQARSTTN